MGPQRKTPGGLGATGGFIFLIQVIANLFGDSAITALEASNTTRLHRMTEPKILGGDFAHAGCETPTGKGLKRVALRTHSTTEPRPVTLSPGRAAVIAAKNDQAVATFLDYRALLQAGAIEGNPHAINVPAVLGAIKGDPTFGPRSRKALWDELDQVERDRLKAAQGGQG